MSMSKILQVVPVLPSQDIERDVNWYCNKVGFSILHADKMYAVLKRSSFTIHLQWHADTEEDPLLGGSVVRILVEDLEPFVTEFIACDLISLKKVRRNTEWGTHEFGFYDLNNNAIFFAQDV